MKPDKPKHGPADVCEVMLVGVSECSMEHAIRCRCKLNCSGKTWQLAGAAFDEHLRQVEESAQ